MQPALRRGFVPFLSLLLHCDYRFVNSVLNCRSVSELRDEGIAFFTL